VFRHEVIQPHHINETARGDFLFIFIFTDLAADRSSDHGTADRADSALISKDRAGDTADARTNSRIPFLRRHAGTACQAKQGCRYERYCRKLVFRFHLPPPKINLSERIRLMNLSAEPKELCTLQEAMIRAYLERKK
jgi:hypothetical protein